MNAIDFLLKEHNKVRRVLTDISNESHHETTKRKMFQALCDDLVRHETMEHKVWYPHFKNNPKLDKTVKHLLSEEKAAAKAIKAFKKIKNDDKWEEKFSDFKKAVLHHAHEEESKLFPNVKIILDKAELENIGKKMYVFKKEYND